MKILSIIAQTITKPYSGHDTRFLSQLDAMSDFAQVDVFVLDQHLKQDYQLETTQGAKSKAPSNQEMMRILRGEAKPYSYLSEGLDFDSLKRKSIENYDCVIFSGLESTSIFEVVRECFSNVPYILDLDESSHRWTKSFLSSKVDRRVKALWRSYFPQLTDYEDRILGEFSQVWVSSQVEYEFLQILHPVYEGLRIVPNALTRNATENAITQDTFNDRIMFVGTFNHLPNKFAVDEIIGAISPLLPNVKFEIVGRYMPRGWLELNEENIEFFPDVADITPHYTRAFASLIPIRIGAGTRIKALESMSFGVPIISTKFGVEGLGMVDGKHYLEAELPEEFAEKIQLLRNSLDLSRELAENGKKLLREKYTHLSLVPTIRSLLETL
jgi:glycosyltransferase involved in cell wall biosynthesis